MLDARHPSPDAPAPLDAADLFDRLYAVEAELRVVYCACAGPDRIEGTLENGMMCVLARQIGALRALRDAVAPALVNP